MRRLRAEAASWFQLPTAAKRRCYCDGFVGYIGEGGENVSASAGKPSAAPDLVESLNLPSYQEVRA